MVTRRVVDDEVDDDRDAPLVRGRDEGLRSPRRCRSRPRPPVVGHVVAVIAERLGDGHQPQAGDAEVVGGGRVAVVELVEAVDEAAQVADTVAVGVLEAADEDLVEDAIRPPRPVRAGARVSGHAGGAGGGGSARARGRWRGSEPATASAAPHATNRHDDRREQRRPRAARQATGETSGGVSHRARSGLPSRRAPDRRAHDGRHAGLGPGRGLLPGLPGPVRVQPARAQARGPGAVGTPPTTHGFKGGDLLGLAERLDELADLGINAIYLNPIFPSASNHRYNTYDFLSVDPLLGGDAALRELLDRGPRARACASSSTACSTTSGAGSGRSTTSSSRAARRRTATGSTSSPTSLAGQRLLTPYPPLDAPTGFSLGYKAWWGVPALPKMQHRASRRARVPPVGRGALAALRDRWLAARRADRDRGPDVLAGVPAPLPRGRPGCLPRRGDLGRSARSGSRATGSTR